MVDLKISVVKLQVSEEGLVYQHREVLVMNLIAPVGYVVKVLERKEEMLLEKYQEKEMNHWFYLYCYLGMGIQELLITSVLEQQQMTVDSLFSERNPAQAEAFEAAAVYLTMPHYLVVFVLEEPFLLAKKEEAFLVVRALIYLQLVVSQQFLKPK